MPARFVAELSAEAMYWLEYVGPVDESLHKHEEKNGRLREAETAFHAEIQSSWARPNKVRDALIVRLKRVIVFYPSETLRKFGDASVGSCVQYKASLVSWKNVWWALIGVDTFWLLHRKKVVGSGAV